MQRLDDVEGWLTLREMEFLFANASTAGVKGEIVEFGFYKGKSTCLLASAIKQIPNQVIHTVDPFDPYEMQASLKAFGLAERVIIHNMTSTEFASNWQKPVRFFWHDGANDEATVRADCNAMFKWLIDGAIVAFHDVINPSGERIYAFDELVLNSPNFGWAGVCGSIGFGQFRREKVTCKTTISHKRELSRRLQLLKPFHSASQPNPRGIRHIIYRLLRSRIPHRDIAIAPHSL